MRPKIAVVRRVHALPMTSTIRALFAAAALVAVTAITLAVAAQAPAVYTPDSPVALPVTGVSVVFRLRELPSARASIALATAIRRRFPSARMRPAFSVPAPVLARMMAEARRNSGRDDIPDLRLFQRIEIAPGLDANAVLRFVRSQHAATDASIQQPAAPAAPLPARS